MSDVEPSPVLSRLWPWVRPHVRKLGWAVLLTLALTGLFQAGPLLIRRAVDHDMAGKDMAGLYLTVALFLLSQALTISFTYAQRLLVEQVAQSSLQSLKERLFTHTLSLSQAFFDRTSVGRLVSRLESDAEALRPLLTFTAISVFGDGLSLLVSLFVMVSVNSGMALVLMAIFVVLVGLSFVFTALSLPVFAEIRERVADISAFLQEHLPAVPILQVFGQEQQTAERMDAVNQRRCAASVKGALIWNTYFNVLFLSEALGICGTLAYGGHLYEQNRITAGAVLMYIEYLRRFFMPIYRVSEQLNVVQRAFAAGRRVFAHLDEVPHVPEPDHPQSWPGLQQGIEFDQVGFAYRTGEPVLHDVSFYLPRGERWAVVGATGSGKSTLVNLMLRFYDVASGSIRIDGIDVRTMRQQDLRRRTALVLQDIVVFPGTLQDNITLGQIVDEDTVYQAASAAALEGTLRQLPDGFMTVLSERGANLSTGQRQLLSFARALAHSPDLLILDEATATVDPETERTVQAALERLLEGRTALVIAHRLSTIRHADRILVLEAGRIVEQGSHEQLLHQNGHYARLYRLQMAQEALLT